MKSLALKWDDDKASVSRQEGSLSKGGRVCCAASIPVYCTGPALILTGSLMMINAAHIDWNDINKAVPAFLTISIMPLTYSISYGEFGSRMFPFYF